MSTELTIIVAIITILITVVTTAVTVGKVYTSRIDKAKTDGIAEGKLSSLINLLVDEVKAVTKKLGDMERATNSQTTICAGHRVEVAQLSKSLNLAWEKLDALSTEQAKLVKEFRKFTYCGKEDDV